MNESKCIGYHNIFSAEVTFAGRNNICPEFYIQILAELVITMRQSQACNRRHLAPWGCCYLCSIWVLPKIIMLLNRPLCNSRDSFLLVSENWQKWEKYLTESFLRFRESHRLCLSAVCCCLDFVHQSQWIKSPSQEQALTVMTWKTLFKTMGAKETGSCSRSMEVFCGRKA